jgi:hypothetical protein
LYAGYYDKSGTYNSLGQKISDSQDCIIMSHIMELLDSGKYKSFLGIQKNQSEKDKSESDLEYKKDLDQLYRNDEDRCKKALQYMKNLLRPYMGEEDKKE